MAAFEWPCWFHTASLEVDRQKETDGCSFERCKGEVRSASSWGGIFEWSFSSPGASASSCQTFGSCGEMASSSQIRCKYIHLFQSLGCWRTSWWVGSFTPGGGWRSGRFLGVLFSFDWSGGTVGLGYSLLNAIQDLSSSWDILHHLRPTLLSIFGLGNGSEAFHLLVAAWMGSAG